MQKTKEIDLDTILPAMHSDTSRAELILNLTEKNKLPEKYVSWAMDYFLTHDSEGDMNWEYGAALLAERTGQYGKAVVLWESQGDIQKAVVAAHKAGLAEKECELVENMFREGYDWTFFGKIGTLRSIGKGELARKLLLEIAKKEEELELPDNLKFAGFLYMESGDKNTASQLYEKAATVYLKQGKKSEAAKVLWEGGFVEESKRLYGELIRDELKNGHKAEAANLAEHALMVDLALDLWEQAGAYTRAAKLATKNKRYDKAIEINLRAGDYSGAAHVAEKARQPIRAIKIYIDRKDYSTAAFVARNNNLPIIAKEMFRKAAKIREEDGDYSCASSYADSGGLEELKQFYDKLQQLVKG